MKGFITLFLIFFLAAGCQPSEDIRQKATGASGIKAKVSQAVEEEGRASKEFVLSADKYGRQDPFDPAFDRKAESYGKGGLSGIVWDEKDPKAIIDGKIVGVGEKAGANTVIKIEQDKVILSDGSRDFEIKLGR